MDVFTRCSLIQLKKKSRLRKEINKLLSKGRFDIEIFKQQIFT